MLRKISSFFLLMILFHVAYGNGTGSSMMKVLCPDNEIGYVLPSGWEIIIPPSGRLEFREDRPFPRECNIIKVGYPNAFLKDDLFRVTITLEGLRLSQKYFVGNFDMVNLGKILVDTKVSLSHKLPEFQASQMVVDSHNKQWLETQVYSDMSRSRLLARSYITPIADDTLFLIALNFNVGATPEEVSEGLIAVNQVLNTIILKKK
ncbi:MAG: hypothetical protein JF599_02345 [Verrucomicrobia bacterium]|nr:hypothetical protein [Verrucomicrobiota bacterium]